jgi:pimeloyl-ACP methyl ester carboxylesterase
MRALEPVRSGYAMRDGVRLEWELFGEGEPTIFLLPTWSIIHSRHWKFQVPYLARHARVLVMDGRGNGGSDRPPDREAYSDQEFAADALAVMDATDTERAALVSLSSGSRWALLLAAGHPERVSAAVFIAPSAALVPDRPELVEAVLHFMEPRDSYEGWWKVNAHYWLQDHRGFLDFFFSTVFSEPHSTKPIEDSIKWGLDTTAETLVATALADWLRGEQAQQLAERVSCPVLVIHGDQDGISPIGRGQALATASGGQLLTMEGSGHCPHVRDPVAVNLAWAAGDP